MKQICGIAILIVFACFPLLSPASDGSVKSVTVNEVYSGYLQDPNFLGGKPEVYVEIGVAIKYHFWWNDTFGHYGVREDYIALGNTPERKFNKEEETLKINDRIEIKADEVERNISLLRQKLQPNDKFAGALMVVLYKEGGSGQLVRLELEIDEFFSTSGPMILSDEATEAYAQISFEDLSGA